MRFPAPVGLQVQGDLFKSPDDGHNWLHYQLGVYNGQGVNHADRNDNKDLIGGLWLSPVKDLCIGAFGWAGEYSKDANGKKITVDRNRMAFGLPQGRLARCTNCGDQERKQ